MAEQQREIDEIAEDLELQAERGEDEVVCHRCGGTGEVNAVVDRDGVSQGFPCPTCGGEGVLPR